MYQEFFLGRGLLVLPIVAMLAFVFTFIGAVWFVLRSAHRDTYDALARMPMSDEDGTAPAALDARSAS